MSLLQTLIEQAKKPNGWIGSTMLQIMNFAHRGMNAWFIRQGAINDGDRVLDIGCGGGKTLQILSKWYNIWDRFFHTGSEGINQIE